MIAVDILDGAKITRDVEELLTNDPLLGGASVLVERSEPEPVEPPQAGWVGIYLAAQRMPLVLAGAGNAGRNHEVELVFACVQSDPTSGAECTDRLGELVKNVIDALFNDGGFAGNVNFLSEARIQYADYTQSESRFRQTAYLHVIGLKRI